MNERFNICEIHICPVYKVGDSFKPDREYPARYCVIDEEKQIAIDIKTRLKYDYIPTASHLYFMSQSYQKIKGDNRVAILPYTSILYGNCNLKAARNIIEELKNNVEFQDGNEVYDNKLYLEYLKQEALKEKENQDALKENNKNKQKKFRKRKK